jgi:predicted pyridoxine 5'-phosphate oxidase superfamily flavin-nucleotide-binding protein
MVTVLHDPGNHLLRIDQVWMAVSVDEDGNEGVCAAPLPGSGTLTMPLIAADEARLPFIMNMAEQLAAATGKKIRIIKLSTRTEVMAFDPRH